MLDDESNHTEYIQNSKVAYFFLQIVIKMSLYSCKVFVIDKLFHIDKLINVKIKNAPFISKYCQKKLQKNSMDIK